MTSTGAWMPVHRSNEAAPCATSDLEPVHVGAPALAAAARGRSAGRRPCRRDRRPVCSAESSTTASSRIGVALTTRSKPSADGGHSSFASTSISGNSVRKRTASAWARSAVAGRDRDRLGALLGESRGHGLGGAARPEHEHADTPRRAPGHDRRAVGARAEHATVADDERVHRSRPRRHLVELVAVAEDRGLVRRSSRSRPRSRVRRGRRSLFQLTGVDGKSDVGPVETPSREGGVLHARRKRVRRPGCR